MRWGTVMARTTIKDLSCRITNEKHTLSNQELLLILNSVQLFLLSIYPRTILLPVSVKNDRFDYSRSGNPTLHAGRALAALEGGAGAVFTGSGMGAINPDHCLVVFR